MTSAPIPAEITTVLDQLRTRIRRYIWIEGLALVVALIGALFWFSFTADVAWFQISKLELPLWFRRSFATISFGLIGAALLAWLVFRLRRSFKLKALALVLEKHFPQLDDRLVTAVELAGQADTKDNAVSRAMLQRTVSDASAAVRQLDLTSVFDSRPLRRAVLAAAVMAVSILGLGVANASAMRRWFDAYIVGNESYWDPYRRSEMSVQVVAQPGDRIREFDADNHYKHARGADLTLLVTVANGKQVPAQVTLRHRSYGANGSSRGSVTMSRVGDRQFRHTLARVIDPHELWIFGGDYTNRTPFQIDVVEPPKVERIELLADYPSYTGLDGLEDQPVAVQGPRVSLPMETSFQLQAQANKPLRSVQLRTEGWQLDLSLSGDSALTLSNPSTNESRRLALPSDVAATFLSGDHRQLSLPLLLSLQAQQQWDEEWRRLESPDASFTLPVPLPLPPDQLLQIYLEDADEILSFDPATVTVNAIPDQPPAVDVRLTGIGNRITRLAMIPMQGRLVDDYGVKEAWFGYQRPGDDQPLTAPLKNPPRGKLTLDLEQSPGDKTERFDVLPLQMEVGQRLNVSLHARDGDSFNGPHESSSPVFAFEIVSDDAVLSDLYDKEMNLRLRFEHIREEVDALRTDLLLHRGRYTDGVKLRTAPTAGRPADEVQEELRQIGVAVQACADRSLHLIRKSHAENREVEYRFADIREELVNNRVDTPDKLERLNRGIIAPLTELNSNEFPRSDEQLGLFGLTLERQQDPTGIIDETVLTLDRMIVKMDRILDQMQQRRGFNEAIQELQGLLERQKKILDVTEQERQRNLIDDLFK
ncbi:MAG: hypothetical protein ACK5Q5_04240 [Planctomycetaceae bacterium]